MAISTILLVGCAVPDFSSHLGQTESHVIANEGTPDATFAGHYGNPPVSWTSQLGTVKSAVWHRPRHDVYCSFEDQNGAWILIDTTTLPKGAVF